MGCMEEYKRWLNTYWLDERLKADLIAIRDDEEQIKSRFSGIMNFGTGGLRGFMGVGTNRMNIYTVRQATKAIGEYIISLGGSAKERGVIIAFDSRNNGVKFARNAALTLCNMGIRAYLFDSLRPTPELSFSIRHLGAVAGINITASHNPKQYNGYKAYFEDGAQIAGSQAEIIMQNMSRIDPLAVEIMDDTAATQAGLLLQIGEEIDKEYIERVLEEQIDLGELSQSAKDVLIVYSPFHGAGYRLVPEILSRIGANVKIVEEQAMPDGDFPTVKSPNPEDREGMTLSINYAKKIGAELIIATDPDADRAACAVVLPDGKAEILSGNQVGCLLSEFIISSLKENGRLPENSIVISTIVSTRMTEKICRDNGIDYYEVLTGFKYIGEKIAELEKSGLNNFLFGFEESCGYLKGTYARDKDAIVASMLIAQMAMYYKNKNQNLIEVLDSLYAKYGYFAETTVNINITDLMPMERIETIMKNLRANTSGEVGGQRLSAFRDYQYGKTIDFDTGVIGKTDLPQSNVLYYIFKDGTTVVVRPSGTEPKIKIYALAKGASEQDCNEKMKNYINIFNSLIQ